MHLSKKLVKSFVKNQALGKYCEKGKANSVKIKQAEKDEINPNEEVASPISDQVISEQLSKIVSFISSITDSDDDDELGSEEENFKNPKGTQNQRSSDLFQEKTLLKTPDEWQDEEQFYCFEYSDVICDELIEPLERHKKSELSRIHSELVNVENKQKAKCRWNKATLLRKIRSAVLVLKENNDLPVDLKVRNNESKFKSKGQLLILRFKQFPDIGAFLRESDFDTVYIACKHSQPEMSKEVLDAFKVNDHIHAVGKKRIRNLGDWNQAFHERNEELVTFLIDRFETHMGKDVEEKLVDFHTLSVMLLGMGFEGVESVIPKEERQVIYALKEVLDEELFFTNSCQENFQELASIWIGKMAEKNRILQNRVESSKKEFAILYNKMTDSEGRYLKATEKIASYEGKIRHLEKMVDQKVKKNQEKNNRIAEFRLQLVEAKILIESQAAESKTLKDKLRDMTEKEKRIAENISHYEEKISNLMQEVDQNKMEINKQSNIIHDFHTKLETTVFTQTVEYERKIQNLEKKLEGKQFQEETESSSKNLPDSINLCCICRDSQAIVVLLPCKHQCFCHSCSKDAAFEMVDCCPICRSEVFDKMEVYV